ncbi:hybrid sensor histidine kinase/response regulator [Polynucleobacter sp. AP-Elch-400A-B2]|uniref:ATP-binding response regulator n=1 Tax=Polynucleobacter sp. AP-Elch-400A-B2 TaxID=2576930 RepID=UPI001BFCE4BF|nr:hybrid sensor histidine kinase/response regulator [Polynucleobacter sp. AP-Elch-400A-B2]QWE24079.1 hybrid sensor histidine kinase/response regulator [Polynucleobacter sp. AP-Elch-400A-B2]
MGIFSAHDNNESLLEEKYKFLEIASRTNTAGTVIGPLFTGILIFQDTPLLNLAIWLIAMILCVMFRAYMIFARNKDTKLSTKKKIFNLNLGVVSVTSCWGVGWLIIATTLPFSLQCIYLLMSSTAVFVGLYGYSIHRSTVICFALPIFSCQFIASIVPPVMFPWPIQLGNFAFFLYTIKMASYFSKSWIETVSLQIQNQSLNKELEYERNTAIEANIAKSKFIATASHDLRQPLHAVNIYLDLLEPNKLKEREKVNFLQIRKSIQTLNSMFNSLLDLSKLDAGASNKFDKPFELIELVSFLSNTFTPIAGGKGLILQFNFMNMGVNGDKFLLQQLIGNLISNAIQYTTSGEIRVHLVSNNDCLHISIEDTGCGIDATLLDKIFEEFFRVDSTRNMHDGLGLGLSIVKRLCKISNTDLSVTSTLGSGSTFSLQTPFSTTTLSDHIEIFNNDSAELSFTSDDHLLEAKTIAIFEDDHTILEAYKQALTQNGFKVLSLSENHQTLMRQLANINSIDCILSDYRLEATTGDLIIQELRDSFGIEIPAIIITADTSPRHIQLFRELNIEMLYKPIGYSDIVDAIKLLLKK